MEKPIVQMNKRFLISTPACEHFGQCGGCNYQMMSYENQLNLKCNQVKELIGEVIEDAPWEPPVSSPNKYEYRNKMEFSFGDA